MKYPSILFVILMLMLSSCATKKKYEYSEKIKYDSISYQSQQVIHPAIIVHDTIKSPCDSLGDLKPFKQQIFTSNGTITITGKDNQITSKIDLKETSSTETKTDKVSNEKEVEKIEKVIIKNDWKIIVILILSVLLNVFLFYLRFTK